MEPRTKQDLGAIALLAVVIAVLWLVRRFTPAVTCPSCGSRSWSLMGEMKQCGDCGHLFF
jgi:flagellar biogenesis protein FliO